MPLYRYRGRHITGKKISGLYEAASLAEVFSYLEMVEVYPTDLEYVPQQAVRVSSRKFFLRRRVPPEKLISTLQTILTLYRSGISLAQAVREAALTCGNRVLTSVLLSINERMAQGTTFSEGCAEYPHVFDPLFVESMRIGEVTGNIEKALEGQIERLNYESLVRRTVKAQSIYPIVLIGIITLVFFLLTNVFIPKMMNTYREVVGNFTLSPKARFFVTTNTLIARHSYLAPLIPISAGLFFVLPRMSRRVKAFYDKVFLRLPVVGGLITCLELARIAGGFHTCTASGLSVRNMLSLVEQSIGNSEFRRIIGKARILVESGSVLSQAMRDRLIPDTFISLLKAGESTGRLSETMVQAQKFYLEMMKERLNTVFSFTSYGILLFLGLIVAYIILSVVVPMFEIPGALVGGVR